MSHSSQLTSSSNLNTPANRRSTAFSSSRSNQVGASLVKKDSSSDLVEAGEMVRRGSSAADMVEQSHPPSSRRGKSNTGTFPTNSVTTTIAGRKSRIITRSEGSEDKIMVTTAAIPVGTAMEVSEGDSSDDVLGADDDYDSASVTSDQLDNIKAETGSGKFRSTSFGDSTAGVTSRENQSIPNKKMSSTNVFSMGIPSSQLSSSQVPGMGSSSGQVKDKILAAKEKNREHAKNTRLRKKNYIESLKKSIKELSDEREKTERDKKQSMNKIMEQTTIRKKNLQDVLAYRCTNTQDYQLWSHVLAEQVVFVLPITPYRSFPPSQVYEGQRVIRGIQGVMIDTASVSVMLQSTITPANTCETKIEAEFICNFQDSVMSEDTFMCKWDFTTKNAMVCGCRSEIVVHGMLKAVFSPVDNKITYMEEIFDVMSIMQQLRRASGKHDFSVIPNTMSLAQDFSNECRLVVDMKSPYNVVYANENWCNSFHTLSQEMIGQSLESIMIQLHCNNSIKPEKMEEIIHALKSALPFCSLLPIFKDQDDRKCRIFIRMLPLYSKGNALHALVTIEKQAADQSSFPSFQFSELPLSLQYEAHLQSGSSHSDSTHSPTASHTTREEETDSTSQHSKMVVHKPIPNRASNSSPLTMASQMMHNDNAIDSNLGVEEEDTDLMHFNQQNTSEEFLFGLLNDFNKDNNNQDLDSMVIDLDQPSFR